MLEPSELALDRATAPVERLPPLRLARDERVEAVGLDPGRAGATLASRAAPLGPTARGVGPREGPRSVLAVRRVRLPGLHAGSLLERDDRTGAAGLAGHGSLRCRIPYRARSSRRQSRDPSPRRAARWQRTIRVRAPTRPATRPGGPCGRRRRRGPCSRRSRLPCGSRPPSGDPSSRRGPSSACARGRSSRGSADRSRRRAGRRRRWRGRGRSRGSPDAAGRALAAEVGVAVDLLVVGEGRRDQRACRFAVGVDGAKLDGHLAAPYARRQCLTPGTRPACAGSTIRYAGCPGRANRVALVRLIADGVAACPRCSTGERLSVVGLPITCAWCGGRAVVSLERARPLYAQLQSKAEREPAAPERRAA